MVRRKWNGLGGMKDEGMGTMKKPDPGRLLIEIGMFGPTKLTRPPHHLNAVA